jgi:hypothetical protein
VRRRRLRDTDLAGLATHTLSRAVRADSPSPRNGLPAGSSRRDAAGRFPWTLANLARPTAAVNDAH